MELTWEERAVLTALEPGLPLVPGPYRVLAETAGLSEADFLAHLESLIAKGVIRRLGIVVRHHELGYRANAMVVWDVPDELVAAAGRRVAALPFVTLCYQRPRRLPDWPYNLFCMIHGRDRDAVQAQVESATAAVGLDGRPRGLLFSRRRFKQRGARYALPASSAEARV